MATREIAQAIKGLGFMDLIGSIDRLGFRLDRCSQHYEQPEGVGFVLRLKQGTFDAKSRLFFTRARSSGSADVSN
jgi:hypothetical protein